jgi:hypothetical protein
MEIKKPTVNERQIAWEDMVDKERSLLLNKGHDYTAGRADLDAYSNFRIIADLLTGCPVTPFTVALVYALKHVLSVITFAKSGKQESGEGLEGRFMDIRNYMFILNELVPDHINFFPQLQEVKVFGGTLAGDAITPKKSSDDFNIPIKETEAGLYYLDEKCYWRPIGDLTLRKEVEDQTSMPEMEKDERAR